jgi:hypothetical protein
VTARELAATSGVSGGTLYSLLGRLTEQGELAKQKLPGGQTGYTPAAADATVPDAVDRDADGAGSAQARPAAEAPTGDPGAAPGADAPPDATS